MVNTIQSADEFEQVTEAMLTATPARDWLGYRGNLAGWGYSSIHQVDTRNVSDLKLAWTWSMGAGSNQTTPLVHDGILYIANPRGTIQALDARSGDLIWEYRRQPPADFVGPAGPHTRNLAIYNKSLYTATADGHLVALDARNGAMLWEVETGDYHDAIQTTGPVVGGGKVFTGRSCLGYLPGGCYILANDAVTGKELWRRYVVPRPGESGDDTWGGLPPEQRRHAGAWGTGSYDPELKLLYWGTSVPAPSNEVIRGTVGADMLFTNSTLALDPDSGRIVWYFQHLPRDNWDLDHTFERMLVDSPVRPDKKQTWVSNPRVKPGVRRKLITGIPGKTGIVWTLDRETGEFLWARETVKQNVISAINPETGKIEVNEAVIPDSVEDDYGLVCPSHAGGKNWQPGAYSPQTNAIYMPLQNTCQYMEIATKNPTPDQLYAINFNIIITPGAKTLGILQAISVESGKTLWKYEQRAGMFTVLATGGGLVFAGDSDRRFRAFDAATGNILWETILQGPVTGTPVSYAVNSIQYVAVTAGGGDQLSGAFNTLVGLPTVRGSNMLYVFALPGNTAPRDQEIPKRTAMVINPHAPPPAFTTAQAERGKAVYSAMCMQCHGPAMAGGYTSPPLKGDLFMSRWRGLPAIRLFDVIWINMPLQAPRSLERETVADILAYWYQLHGYKPGRKALMSDPGYLEKLRIQPLP
jgi:alcohol dehydrogenase (cytochrome c)